MIVLGFAVCLFILVSAGIYSLKNVKGKASNFLVAGRTLGAPMIALLCMTQVIDSNATVGAADLSAEFGFWAGAAMPIGVALSVLLLGLFIAKPLRRTGVLTLPEFFARRFGRGTEITASLLTIGTFGILLAGNLVALGYLMEYFLGLHYVVAVLVLIPLALIYTMAGGMFASVYTGVVQFVVMAIGIVSLVIWMGTANGFSAPEGFGAADLEQLTDESFGAVINWATIIGLGLGNLVAIDLSQRVLSARSPEAARNACLAGAVGIVAFCVPLSLVAISAIDIVGDTGGVPILYVLLGEHTPLILSVLVLAGLLTASVTTVSGILLSASTIVVHNVLRLDGHDSNRSRQVMWATRLTMLPLAMIAVVVALRVQQTGILLTLTFDLLMASLVVPFLLGLFWKRGGPWAVTVSVIAGLGARLIFFVLTPTIYGVDNTLLYFNNDLVDETWDGWSTFLAASISLVTYVLVALLTPPKAQERPHEGIRQQLGEEVEEETPVELEEDIRPGAQPAGTIQ